MLKKTENISQRIMLPNRLKQGGLKRDGFIYEMKKNYPLYIFLIPMFVFFIIFDYLPIFGMVIAFKRMDYSLGILGSPWAGFENFKYLFKTPDVWVITRNTVLYNVAFILTSFFFAVVFAVFLNEVKSSLTKKFYQGVLFIPHFLSWVIMGYLVYVFLSPQYGFINKGILTTFGLKEIEWYSSPQFWPFILVFVNLWKGLGYSTIVYLAAIAGIDQELYEAAVIDGAGKFKQTIHITLPCIKPAIVIQLIMAIGSLFSTDFGLFYYVTRNVPTLYPTTQVMGLYTYRALREMGDVGMASAAAFYQSIVGFILVVVANQIVRKIDSELSLY
ncbi:MAG: ABC transporter permease subunit [Firmicutes bacterium]|nr:ABC transporter permease subunit [Bacillota bacterium]